MRTVSLWLLGILFVVAGLNHFLNPEPYLAMMPPLLPWPEALNFIAGGAEILGGIGVLVPMTRRLAAWGLIALLVAVFPANFQIALYGWPGHEIPAWAAWGRLPFQFLFIWWVHATCLKTTPPRCAPRADEGACSREG